MRTARTRRPVRSGLATLTVAVVVTATTAVAALALPLAGSAAATTTDPAKVGLYGSQDPTFDGVYRQSLSLLATVAAGRTPPTSAFDWLLRQQCADGGFEAFRTPLTAACTAPSSVSFSGEDTNSTGIAAQALQALGLGTQAGRAVDWLGGKQSADGGWAYYPDGAAGNDPDANSTALGLSAFLAVGRPAPHAGGPTGPTPYDALEGMQVGCEGAADDQGAFTFFGSPNDYATVQATLAMGGGFLPVPVRAGADDAPVLTCPPAPHAPAAPVTPAAPKLATPKPAPTTSAATSTPAPSATVTSSASATPTATASAAASASGTPTPTSLATAVPEPTKPTTTRPTTTKPTTKKPTPTGTRHVRSTTGLTPSQAADAAAGYLVRRLAANGHVIPDAFNPGQADYGSTANAVLALVWTQHGSSAVTAALAALAGQVDPFVVKSGADQPGALALLVLAAVAGGDDPTAFGGSNLVDRLAATVTVAAAPPSSPTATPEPAGGGTGDGLPDTGADTRVLVGGLVGALLVLGGSTLLWYGRRELHRA